MRTKTPEFTQHIVKILNASNLQPPFFSLFSYTARYSNIIFYYKQLIHSTSFQNAACKQLQ